jgi:hypothetical protein
MADDKTRAPDRSRIMTGQDNELRQFADTHGISVRQVRELVERVGNGRSALEAAVLMLKS